MTGPQELRIPPQYRTYGVDDGEQITTVHTGGASTDNWAKTVRDMLGRSKSEVRTGFSHTSGTPQLMTTAYSYFNDNSYDGDDGTYHSKGQLAASATTGMASTVYKYDQLGNMVRSGRDVDDDGDLESSGSDRISTSETTYVQQNATYTGSGTDWWRVTARLWIWGLSMRSSTMAVSDRRGCRGGGTAW